MFDDPPSLVSRLVAATWILLSLLGNASLGQAQEKKPQRLRIAFVESLFRDSPAALAKPVIDAFGAMVQAQTGLEAEVLRGEDSNRLGRKICENDVQFGIFQGVEYAWAKQKHPELKPLMIIINQHPQRHGALVVRADSKAKDFADLKGKPAAMPLSSRCHCELFLERGTAGVAAKTFFSDFQRPGNAEDMLDDLVDGQLECAVVDVVALESFARRKPARFAKLKVLKKSEPFPATVVAYRPGKLDGKRLAQFTDGLMRSNESILGRHLMMLWRMSAFEKVPGDFDRQLEEIVKLPGAEGRESRERIG